MVTPQDFIDRVKSYPPLVIFIILSGEKRFICHLAWQVQIQEKCSSKLFKRVSNVCVIMYRLLE